MLSKPDLLCSNLIGFNKICHRLGCDPEKLFPYEALQEQLKKFGLYAIPMAGMLLPVLTARDGEVLDLDELGGDQPSSPWCNPLDNPLFIERMRGIIDDVVRLGFI